MSNDAEITFNKPVMVSRATAVAAAPICHICNEEESAGNFIDINFCPDCFFVMRIELIAFLQSKIKR